MLITLSIITGILFVWFLYVFLREEDIKNPLICLGLVFFCGWFLIGNGLSIKSKTEFNLIQSKDLSVVIDDKSYTIFITDLSDNDKVYIFEDAKTYNLIKDYGDSNICVYKKIKYNMYNKEISKEFIVSDIEIK